MTETSAPPPLRPHRYRPRGDRRSEIIGAALLCLQDEGFARLTARRIAARAGLSLGHISYHFRDMEELLCEAYRLASRELRTRTDVSLAESGGRPEDRLSAFLAAGFAPGLMTPAYIRLRVDLWAAALRHASVAQAEATLYADYRARLERLLADMAAPAARGRIAATGDAIMAMLDGLWLDWARRQDRAAVDNGIAACLELALRLRA